MGVRAIDVSRWQGTINWDAVAADGVHAAWIKVAGADVGLYRDGRATVNLTGVANAGIEHGTYYFCVPDTAPEAQARHAVDCGHGTGGLPPAADVEVNPHGLDQRAIDEWVTRFCHEVHHLTGRESLVYTYSAAGLVGYTPAAPSHCRLWVANYGRNSPGAIPPLFSPAVPPAWARWDVWQFNSVTPVPGIEGSVDQNVIADSFWVEHTDHAAVTPMEDDHMDTLIVDARPDRLSGWLLSGRLKTWVPSSAFVDLLEDAANTGRGDLKVPPAEEGGILQAGGSPWIARLDLAKLTNPEDAPVELGGTGHVDIPAEHAAMRAHLARHDLDPG